MAKHSTGDPTALPAAEALELATVNPGRAFGLEVGVLAPGMLADFILVDLDHPLLFPGHDLVSDLVYSAHGRAVKTTVCDGRVLMENGIIEGEQEVRREVKARLRRLLE
jgi:5-methylthioadenosine/S-adenosylhomocysteine deaminase